jgi:hypothetical protein
VFIVPFTLPKPVTAPLFDPTLPVTLEVPVLVTAPLEVKRTKFAAVPRLGAWAKLKTGKNSTATTVATVCRNLLFIEIGYVW